jgi:hypothetical protein
MFCWRGAILISSEKVGQPPKVVAILANLQAAREILLGAHHRNLVITLVVLALIELLQVCHLF